MSFHRFVARLTRSNRMSYWGSVEVPYKPFYAFEEVLAVFAERPRQTASVLSAMEAITRYITADGQRHPTSLREMPEETRRQGLKLFFNAPAERGDVPTPAQTVYVSYRSEDHELVEPLVRGLVRTLGSNVWWDRMSLLPGDDWREEIDRVRRTARFVLVCFSPDWLPDPSRPFDIEVEHMLKTDVYIIPVLLGGLRLREWSSRIKSYVPLAQLVNRQAVIVAHPASDENHGVEWLSNGLKKLLAREAMGDNLQLRLNPDDPQKGRWGRSPTESGRQLTATVNSQPNGNWFTVTLKVTRLAGQPLTGEVVFHLHPTFPSSVRRVQVQDDVAILSFNAWGAFTVGAVADGGLTELELDLAEDPSFPPTFRER